MAKTSQSAITLLLEEEEPVTALWGMPLILAIYCVIALSGFVWIGFLLFKKRRRMALFASLLTPAALVAWFGLTALDRVASWIYPHDTIYAPMFSQARFDSVVEGMATKDMLQLLGKPLDKRLSSDHREYWYYSRHGPRFENYWNFIVVTDPVRQRVVRRFREFYTD